MVRAEGADHPQPDPKISVFLWIVWCLFQVRGEDVSTKWRQTRKPPAWWRFYFSFSRFLEDGWLGVIFFLKWGGDQRRGGAQTLIWHPASEYSLHQHIFLRNYSLEVKLLHHLGYFIRSCFKTCSNSAMLGIFIAALLSVGRLYTSTTSYSGTTGSHLRLFPTMTYFTAYLAITPNLCNLAVVLITTIYKSKDESLSHGVCDW